MPAPIIATFYSQHVPSFLKTVLISSTIAPINNGFVLGISGR